MFLIPSGILAQTAHKNYILPKILKIKRPNSTNLSFISLNSGITHNVYSENLGKVKGNILSKNEYNYKN